MCAGLDSNGVRRPWKPAGFGKRLSPEVITAEPRAFEYASGSCIGYAAAMTTTATPPPAADSTAKAAPPPISTTALITRMLDSGKGISDLVFSPGRPPQVERSGHLTAVDIAELPLLRAPD